MPKADNDECSDCKTLQNQIGNLLDQVNLVQAQCERLKQERDAYLDSCVQSRHDVLEGNKLFFDQKAQLVELRDKVALYQETNQMLFEKCAHVNDLEGEIKQLKARISELEDTALRIRREREESMRLSQNYSHTETSHGEPNLVHYPSRELALKNLTEHIERLPDFLKPLSKNVSQFS